MSWELIHTLLSGDTSHGGCTQKTCRCFLSIISEYRIDMPDRCTDANLSFHVSIKLLTNDSYEHRQSVVENRPTIAWYVARCVLSYIFLVNCYVEYGDYAVFSILVCVRALFAQRTFEPRGQFACNIKLHFDVSKIGQSLDKSSVRYNLI